MLSCFDLDACTEIEAFRADYLEFFAKMRSLDLGESTGPIGRRQSDTRMDTDDERQHEYFVIMSFRDRKQVDAAYAYIKNRKRHPQVDALESQKSGIHLLAGFGIDGKHRKTFLSVIAEVCRLNTLGSR